MEQITDQTWKLKNIKIEFVQWGEFKDKYVGKIEFENGKGDAFTFSLKPDLCAKYLELIASEIGTAGEQLGKDLLKSLPIMIESSKTIELTIQN